MNQIMLVHPGANCCHTFSSKMLLKKDHSCFRKHMAMLSEKAKTDNLIVTQNHKLLQERKLKILLRNVRLL